MWGLQKLVMAKIGHLIKKRPIGGRLPKRPMLFFVRKTYGVGLNQSIVKLRADGAPRRYPPQPPADATKAPIQDAPVEVNGRG